jgi:transcriptional regulator with XRE-family HTH domain
MSAQKGASGFGDKLREARERRGLSLRQIANATKISMITLEALERNDVKRLPGGIFSRAFVRSYALEVGLDPESTIEEFMGQFPQDSVTAGHPTTTQVEDHEAMESDRRMASTFLRLVLLSLPIGGLVIYFGIFGRPSAARAVAAPATPVAAPAETVTPAVVEPDPAPAAARDTAAAAPVNRLVVQVKAAQRCWVSAIVDGQRAAQRTFLPGDEQTFEVDREMVLTAGDPAALTVTLNGATARPLGPGGQQATARLTPANFKEFLPTP